MVDGLEGTSLDLSGPISTSLDGSRVSGSRVSGSRVSGFGYQGLGSDRKHLMVDGLDGTSLYWSGPISTSLDGSRVSDRISCLGWLFLNRNRQKLEFF